MPSKDQILTYIAYVVIAAVIIGGGFFVYQKYYPLDKTENNKNQEALKEYNIAGQVVSINKDILKIKINNEEKNIKVTPQTVINKSTLSPSGAKNITIQFSEIQIGRSVEITLAKDSKIDNLIAEKIQIYNKRVISGIIQSIDSENISIGYDKAQASNIKITSQTSYYKTAESGTPEKINFSEIQIGDLATVFLTDDAANKDRVADSIQI